MEDLLRLDVPAAAAGERLDRALAEAVGSRSRAQALIDAGEVLVDGRRLPKRHVLHGGERVVVRRAPVSPAEATGSGEAAGSREGSASYEVHYEDEWLLVVEKPAGVVVHPARGHRGGTLAQALSARGAAGGDPWRAGIVHRLDRDTSGLLVVAKSEPVHARLKELLAERELRREYLALVDGRPPARTGTIDAAIGRDRRNRVIVSLDTDEPREARTHYVIERMLPRTSLLRVTLETGRTHQIRVHLKAIGHPVCGDPSYGVSGRLGLTRQFLHAVRLSFPHPVSGEVVEAVSPLPGDLASALGRAESEA